MAIPRNPNLTPSSQTGRSRTTTTTTTPPQRKSLFNLNLTATLLTILPLLTIVLLPQALATTTIITTTITTSISTAVSPPPDPPISYIQYTPPSPQQQLYAQRNRQQEQQHLGHQQPHQNHPIIDKMAQPPPPIVPHEEIIVPVEQHVPVVTEVPVAPVQTQYTVCVFCGASPGTPAIAAAATTLGRLIAEESWTLLYGGGTVGIMGTVASGAISAGGQVHGIVPSTLINKEQEGAIPDEAEYGKTTVVKDMHTRKIMMGKFSNAFVALPGGFGTLDELFEVTTWNQLGIHDSPIVVVNINGFYDGIMQWLDKAVEFKLVSPDIREILVVVDSPEAVIPAIKNYRAANGRWNLDWNSA